MEVPTVNRFDPASGRHRSWSMPGTYLGSLALMETNKLLLALDLALFAFDPDGDETTPIVEIETGLDNRLNDGRIDASGRLWIGTMDNQYVRPNGSLYRVDPDGSVTRMFGEVKVTNGIAFSPDNRTFYFTDTRRFCTWAFDMDPEAGILRNRRLFADYRDTGERPDGVCVDVDGCLWTAFFASGKIVRYDPSGRIDREIHVPVSNPTCVCFGGRS